MEENQIIISGQNQCSTNLSVEVVNMGLEVFKINQLRGYPLSDSDIINWSKTLTRLMPEKTPADVREAIDQMIIGKIYYDKQAGIQNIVNAMKILDGSDFTDRL